MPKYHVNIQGNPGVCRARKRCPFGDLETDHYSSQEEARAAYEKLMQPTSKADAAPSVITKAFIKTQDEMTQRLLLAAVHRPLSKGRHGDRDAEAYWAAAYDSTPAGQLWLDRKRKERGHWEKESKEWLNRTAAVERFLEHIKDNPVETSLPEDPGHCFAKEFSTSATQTYADRYEDMRAEKVKLSLLSAAWLTKLTPEETEAVSWVTSNGSSVINNHLHGKELSVGSYEKYPEEFINGQLKLYRQAMAKAPELDEPMIIYRGTTTKNAKLTYLDGPASATASMQVAKGFDNGEGEPVILEIKTRKVPSVAGMSAWGVSELEVLSPLGEYRKVNEFDAVRYKEGKEKESEFDKVHIIQLEYIG